MDELPVGTITFLFTDVEGSTRLLKLWRERYAEALAEHQRTLREAFSAHDGREIDTQGDSFFVAFRRAKDAVAAAVEGQRRLSEQEWPEGGELRVRMGIHTGEPLATGTSYVGLGVHRAARICAAGHGGQVLVSQTTRELLRDDPLPGVTLRDLGEHQLKDLDEPERLFQLVAEGLGEEFPPLTAASTAPFAGRESELAAAAAEQLARRWRPSRRTFALAILAAAVVGGIVGLLATLGGGSAANASVQPNSVGVIDAGNGRVVAGIAVGASPGGVAVGAGAVWVANTDDGTVSKIDPATGAVQQTIQVGASPVGVAVGGGAVWVANGLSGTVSRIDPSVNRQVATIAVGNGPVSVAYGAGAVWVVDSVDGTLSKIDPSSGRVVFTRPAVSGANGVSVGLGRVWIVSASKGVVVAIDPSSGAVVGQVQVGVNPDAVAVGVGAVWVANRADGTVSRIDPGPPAHVSAVIQVGRAPDAVSVGDGIVWIADAGDGSVTGLNASTGLRVRTVRLANPPQGIAAFSSRVYVAVRSNDLQHRGGTLRVAEQPPDDIDPAFAYSAAAWQVLAMTNDGLVGFRRVGGIEGVQLVPDLAVSLPTPTDDGRTYTFQLRSGIRYSNGQPVQPADIRTELQRIFEVSPMSGGRQYFGGIVGAGRCQVGRQCDLSRGIVIDTNARTITFHLTAPDADFLSKLAMPWADAVPSNTPGRDLDAHPVASTGPYVITAYNKNRSLTLARNPRFREWSADAQPAGFPDVLKFSYDNAYSSLPELHAVQGGTADIAISLDQPALSKQQLTRLATNYPSQLRLSPLSVTDFFVLNTKVAPFNDPRLRVALDDEFDRQGLARTLGLGFTPTCQILPPDYPSFRRICLYRPLDASDLARVKQLVRKSGYDRKTVTVWVPVSQGVDARFMVSALRRLGFKTRVRVVSDINKYFARISDSRTKTQVAFDAWFADFPSVAGFLPPLFSCGSFIPASPGDNQDPSEFCDPVVDRLLAQATSAQSRDPAAASALWQGTERAILAEAPIVPTYNQQDVSFLSRRLQNFEYHPQWGVLLDQLWSK